MLGSCGKRGLIRVLILGELVAIFFFTLSHWCSQLRDLYLWASTIFVSRAFSAKVLSGAIADEDLPEDSVSVLLPFVDILNHRPLAKVEWRAAEKDVFFLTLEEVAAGQEVSNNYGPRNNEQREFLYL